MLDAETVRIAREQIAIDGDEQRLRLLADIRAAEHRLASKGMHGSGSAASQLTTITIDSLQARAEAAWRILHRCVSTAGIGHSGYLASELKAEIATALPGDFAGITDGLLAYFRKSDVGNVKDQQLKKLVHDARATVLRKVGSEIDLFVHALSRQADRPNREALGAVFNIYSPVASIQTGHSSTATVSQVITSETKVSILQALDAISHALNEHPGAFEGDLGDVDELVVESKRELDKPAPNVTKIRGFLSAIGGAIQTTASLQPAYAALKSAAAFIGVSLP